MEEYSSQGRIIQYIIQSQHVCTFGNNRELTYNSIDPVLSQCQRNQTYSLAAQESVPESSGQDLLWDFENAPSEIE